MDVIETVVVAFWAMLPAYVPNNAAVLFGGGRPIDGGRTWGDSRLLGDGKTWRGTAGGTATGVALALGLNAVRPTATDALAVSVPEFPIVAAVTLAAGAMVGDVTASFVKRRSGRERGAAFPGLDQLDFVVGALVPTAILAPGWFGETFTVPVLAVVLVITPLLHVGTNVVAYYLGLKDEPW
ncbi:CDP-2,3-bis-(O-geranylgeranyl)-sn-glycerol synthase [Halapricum desulfuricans]|uniref:CDP-archaeol synthase n=1 Tax=Halapricum desulfuricans TaxID=2841257 RepID=A0A897N9J3_9EURY|nr:CDP-2,3-bis-(O-geranylgeranyl)-sn-glycerol synthase [Halapricum desulfuricans]QSG04709.1 CDP-diglyceride synthetase [Halapricum desulfuricans]QSG11060.1 CDP-diglyceride synthetase [Halapricum desulfuricans]